MLRRTFGLILLDPAASDPTGGAPPAVAAPDLKKEADGLVASHGDPTAALLVLLGRTHSDRDAIKDLRGKLPAEGSVILSGDDAKHWGDYRKLGDPASLRKTIDEGATAKSEVGTYRKADSIRSAAKVTRIDGSPVDPEVLGTLARDVELVVDDLKDDKGNPVGEDGKPLAKDAPPIKASFVKEGEKLTRLDAYAKAHWGKFLPSLKAQAQEQAGARKPGSPAINRERPIPASGSGGAARPARRSTL